MIRVDPQDAHHLDGRPWHTVNGYASRIETIDGTSRRVYLHRRIMGLDHGDPRQVDHVNRDRLNNRRENLRILTAGENKQNVPKRPGLTSRYRGVSWYAPGRKWRATVKHGGRQHSAGYFHDEEQAANAARELRARLLPFSTD